MWKALLSVGKYIATHPWVWALADQVRRNVVNPIIKKLKSKKDVKDKEISNYERPKTGDDSSVNNSK